MADPWPLSPYATVRARFADVSGDGPDPDTHPDWTPAEGERVTLTPSISGLLVYDPQGPDPIIIRLRSLPCVVDADGWLVTDPGAGPVRIPATDDPLMTATGWTWTAVMQSGTRVTFSAPSGGVVELADFVTAPAVDATRQWVDGIPLLVQTAEDLRDAIAEGGGGGGGSAPDATASVKGVLRLAGDLAGTAASPTVPGLAGKADVSHTHVIADVTDYAPPSWPVAGTPAVVAAGADKTAARAAIDAVASSDSRLSDARAPLAHVHGAGDVTSGVLATARLGTGTANADKILYGDGSWKDAPTGGGGGESFLYNVLPEAITSRRKTNSNNADQPPVTGTTYAYGNACPTPAGVPIVGIRIYQTAAGRPGDTVTVLVYDSASTGKPSTKLLETIVSLENAGDKNINLSATPDGGLLWVFFTKGTSGTPATLAGVDNNAYPPPGVPLHKGGSTCPAVIGIPAGDYPNIGLDQHGHSNNAIFDIRY